MVMLVLVVIVVITEVIVIGIMHRHCRQRHRWHMRCRHPVYSWVRKFPQEGSALCRFVGSMEGQGGLVMARLVREVMDVPIARYRRRGSNSFFAAMAIRQVCALFAFKN